MDEYISKQKVLDYLNSYLHSLGEGGADALLFDRGQRRALINSIQDISAVKAADVQPVKHGRWEYDHTIGGMKHYHCTNCKNSGNECIADENEILWWEFCPRCSARMDLKDGDSDDKP